MFSFNNNSYIQSRTGPSPKLINRAVNKARLGYGSYDVKDICPEFDRLTSHQPCIPMGNFDVTRRPLAFGRLKITELRRELHCGDEDLMLASLHSFCDILHDPEVAYTALNLGVPERLADLMVHEHPKVRERTCLALMILAGSCGACMTIVNNAMILRGLKTIMDDVEGHVRYKAAMLIERVCLVWPAAEVLIRNDFIEALIDCVMKDAPEISSLHLKSLEAMFCTAKGLEIAFDCNFFKFLLEFIETAPDIVLPGALRSLGNMLIIHEVKLLAIESNLLKTLAVLIHHGDPAVYNAATFALMFATLKMRPKMQAFSYTDMPGRLVELAYNWQNEESQIYCIKALTNLCEYPPMRLKVHKAYFKAIVKIQTRDRDVQKYKDILLDLVADVSNLEQKIFMEDVQSKAASNTMRSQKSLSISLSESL